MALRTDVSALYIDPRGPYPKLVADCWDEARDARNYAGPNPVVAHPPCGGWGPMRHLYSGDDKECGLRAVDAVRRFGGVVEQPMGSKLFEACGIAETALVFVEQVAWGHCCRKPTWLYFAGVPILSVLESIRRGGEPTHQIYGSRSTTNAKKHGRRADLKAASAEKRRRTPIAFAEWLISLAAQAKRTEAA